MIRKLVRLLNRVIYWDEKGIGYEPDQRHADMIIRDLGMVGKRGLSTPGVKSGNDKDEEGDEEELGNEDSTRYRSITARANFLSQDRSDIKYAVKELTRHMAKPRCKDEKKLIRLGKYLIGRERYICRFDYQDKVSKLSVWTDTDYAGCRETRKSTSGGLVQYGNHMLKFWSSTQKVIALSSGEAE